MKTTFLLHGQEHALSYRKAATEGYALVLTAEAAADGAPESSLLAATRRQRMDAERRLAALAEIVMPDEPWLPEVPAAEMAVTHGG